jgi:hypothetical protein
MGGHCIVGEDPTPQVEAHFSPTSGENAAQVGMDKGMVSTAKTLILKQK